MSAAARLAAPEDAAAAGRLLHRFNAEYDEPTPPAEEVGRRVADLIAGGETAVLLAGEGPDGIAVVRFRPAIFSAGKEAYLAELYVVPESRRRGLGTALMTALLGLCRERGCDRVELGTDEGDDDAQRLYERFGFSGYGNPGDPPAERRRMYFYERDL